jgi:hypothetical protein
VKQRGKSAAKPCSVCGTEHDDEAHEASLRVRAYLRSTLEHIIAPEPEVVEQTGEGGAAA